VQRLPFADGSNRNAQDEGGVAIEDNNVNKATAKDIETIAGLSSKDAGDIVQYREAKGNFKTVDDLKKVPGIDADKLEANKQLLEFA
jgi:competence protein ComEA